MVKVSKMHILIYSISFAEGDEEVFCGGDQVTSVALDNGKIVGCAIVLFLMIFRYSSKALIKVLREV